MCSRKQAPRSIHHHLKKNKKNCGTDPGAQANWAFRRGMDRLDIHHSP